MTAPTISADLTRTAKNPYELALWVVAGTLILGSGITMIWAQGIFSSNNQGWTGAPPLDMQIAQIIYSFQPGALTGGIILAGMALAIRAVAFDRRTAAALIIPAQHETRVQDEEAAVTPMAPVRTRNPSASVDHTPYMRPKARE